MRASRVRRLLGEPLLHFLVAGFVLFLIYGGLHGARGKEEPRRIEVSADDIRRIQVSWLAQWQRPATTEELNGLIEDHIKEEVLYREALSLGLDKDDTIVRRRLAQKMDFLADDVVTPREPAPEELQAWFAQNQARYAPERLITFHHLFFSSDRRGAGAQAQASKQLAAFTSGKASDKDATGGDTFMFQSAYAEETQDRIARVFGTKFADSVFRQEAGGWYGPVESGYGWHLVWVDALTSSQPSAFDAVAQQVKEDWLAEQRATQKQVTLDSLRARYEIVVAKPPPAGTGAAAQVRQ
ncbi:MAG: peptidyl-prolyl cis-trans isomerase [Proteobacteria bacterium]|nr:peptidyl-prolyl cis-trans isomerase [Pseudomonadota bacterium]